MISHNHVYILWLSTRQAKGKNNGEHLSLHAFLIRVGLISAVALSNFNFKVEVTLKVKPYWGIFKREGREYLPNVQFQKKSQISFCRILKTNIIMLNILLKRFHLNGHTKGVRQQTQKLELHYMSL